MFLHRGAGILFGGLGLMNEAEYLRPAGGGNGLEAVWPRAALRTGWDGGLDKREWED